MKQIKSIAKRIFQKISNHFLLRQLILITSAVIVLIFIISLGLNIFTRHSERLEVPKLIGNTLAKADEIADHNDLRLEVIDSIFVAGMTPGTVIDQTPDAGNFVKSGRKVFLIINAFKPRSEVIPYVTGYSLRQAKNILQAKGFTIDKLIYKWDMATNNVIGQSYKGKNITADDNIVATLGEGITLTVGKGSGAALPLVPKVVGLTLREAQSRLWELGLNVGDVIKDNSVTEININEARVYKQNPGQQRRLDFGARVTLYLSADENRISTGIDRSDQEIFDARENPSEEISQEEFDSLFSM